MSSTSDASRGTPRRPRPAPDATTEAFWSAAAAGRLVVLRCSHCATFRHPPVPVCRHCRSDDASWDTVSGQGAIHSVSVLHQASVAGFEEWVPYACIVVELDEQSGLLLVGNLLGVPPEEAVVGRRVRVTFEAVADADSGDSWVLPQFELDPDHEGAAGA